MDLWADAVREAKEELLENDTDAFFQITTFKSSLPEMFCKKGVLKNFAKFTRKHRYQSLFFNNVAGLYLRKDFDTGAFL